MSTKTLMYTEKNETKILLETKTILWKLWARRSYL